MKKKQCFAARKIGFPVLVRPSYVLGGRAMEIVENERRPSFLHANCLLRLVQTTQFLSTLISLGKSAKLMPFRRTKCPHPGIMVHIERAGVHSGDSMAVYPPQTLSQKVQETIADYTKRLAIGLNCLGMMNIQFVIKDEKVYVIEVNPRASRTVPFLSKVTNIPMAQVATKLILGQKS